MLKALVAFKREHGHCNVSTTSTAWARLGRWVAAQRYKHRVGDLPDQTVKELTALGFVWAPADLRWEAMYQALKAFAKKHGHTNVPEHCPSQQKLANWVHSQRHRRRRGKLSSERVRQLDALKFCWGVYKSDFAAATRPVSGKAAVAKVVEPEAPAPEEKEERLYVLREGLYVQYNGKGRLPAELKAYCRVNGGELPAHIPLPAQPVTFTLAQPPFKGRKVAWKGTGPLPREVLAYVKEHGVLPRRDL
jgi:hypothetical protein